MQNLDEREDVLVPERGGQREQVSQNGSMPPDMETVFALDAMGMNNKGANPGRPMIVIEADNPNAVWPWTIISNKEEQANYIRLMYLTMNMRLHVDLESLLTIKLASNVALGGRGREDYIQVETGTRSLMARMGNKLGRVFGLGGGRGGGGNGNGNFAGY